jgi:hypothetical protein
MKTLRAIAAATAVTVALGVANAQTPSGPPPGGSDRGERGALFVSPMGQPFRAAPDSGQAPILVWLQHADTDGDERISRDEFMSEALAFFADDLDTNRDQTVIPLESTEFRRLHAPEVLTMNTAPVAVASPRERRESATGIRGARPMVRTRNNAEGMTELTPAPTRDQPARPSGRLRQDQIMLGAEVEPVMSCDRDFSRRIDAAEFRSCAERRFLALDANRDGFFTLDESERAQAMLEAGQ